MAVASEVLVRLYAYCYGDLLIFDLCLQRHERRGGGGGGGAQQREDHLQLNTFEYTGREVYHDGRVLCLHAASAAGVAKRSGLG
jgi:hypothetical protein